MGVVGEYVWSDGRECCSGPLGDSDLGSCPQIGDEYTWFMVVVIKERIWNRGRGF